MCKNLIFQIKKSFLAFIAKKKFTHPSGACKRGRPPGTQPESVQ